MLPIQIFDEAWYLETNKDIAEAVDMGKIASGEAHFRAHGVEEGRTAKLIEPDRILAFGAFGTNNVGDEAIFRGLLREYPDLYQIFINRPTHPKAFPYPDMRDQPELYRAGDHLVLGGGGLLFNVEMMDCMIAMAKHTMAAGGTVSIEGLGCEAADPEFYDKIVELFGLANKITVRTHESVNIVREITGKSVPLRRDFAYNLGNDMRGWRGAPTAQVTIGLVTNGDLRCDYLELVDIINNNTVHASLEDKIRFVHIPHSRAFVDMHNNDEIMGQAIWNQILSYIHEVDENFVLTRYSDDPMATMDRYRSVDGIISERFHGLVFADMVGLPALSMRGGTRKNAAFAETYGTERLFVADDDRSLTETFEIFLADVKARKAARLPIL